MSKDSDTNGGRADARRLGGRAEIFTHPDEVLQSCLSPSEKRVLLAAWASDAHAVPNMPTMRQLDSGAIVDIDDVLAALRALDVVTETAAHDGPRGSRETRRSLDSRWLRPFRRRRDDDDDDPPPCPATALPPGVEREIRRHRDVTWAPLAA